MKIGSEVTNKYVILNEIIFVDHKNSLCFLHDTGVMENSNMERGIEKIIVKKMKLSVYLLACLLPKLISSLDSKLPSFPIPFHKIQKYGSFQ
jgi:hypothetical protein